MQKKQLFTIAALSLSTFAWAQRGIDAAGGDASGSGGSVSYSIGQIDYIAAADGSNSIIQGLQQPFEISVIQGVADLNIQLSMSVYPNPTADQLILSVNDVPGDLNYQLVDIAGKMVAIGTISNKMTTVDVRSLANATYFLRVTDGKSELKTFKIVKN